MDIPNTSPLQTAVKLIGGPSATAREFGISPAAVSRWLKKDKAPSGRCIEIEDMVDGAVTRYALRPDIFGSAPAQRRKRTT